MCAARFGSIENVTMMISAGADINAKDYAGRTALKYADSCGRADIGKAY